MAENEKNKVNTTKEAKEGEDTQEEVSYSLEWEPHEFKAFGKTTRVWLSDLAKAISDQFRSSFNDYLGTNIEFNGRNFNVTLIFEKGRSASGDANDKMDNLVDFKNNTGFDKKNLYSSMTYLNKKTSGKTYELNDETKQILSKFMYGGPKAKRDWNQLVTERRYPANNAYYQMGSENVCIMVTGIDFSRLLQEFYGNTMITSTVNTEDGTINKTAPARYSARIGKMFPDGRIVLNIEQFDYDEIQKITLEENPTLPNTNGLVYF